VFGQLIRDLLRSAPLDHVMACLAQVSAYDRYQASHGIERAADLVADAARASGLAAVSVERLPADGAARWWSFHAPVSWTPSVARLEVRAGDRCGFAADHARQPFTVATYSAPTPPEGVVAPLVDLRGSSQEVSVAGAVAVLGRSEFTRQYLLPSLIAGGALGFVTDAPARGSWPEPEHPGRIELDPGTPLFGFSVTPRQLASIRALAAAGAEAEVVVTVDRSARMPLVTGVLPGARSAAEVWLIAHLCHPRPGANDNASGVAALLGIAAALAALRREVAGSHPRRTLRFAWGPEFVGTAALLHRQLASRGRAGLPQAVINCDMVGEDQAQCGCPFIVERSPDFPPALLNPIAEHVVSQVFAQTKHHYGTWRPEPFSGFSDHALFADPRLGCAAVHLCHAPDRFAHSAGDSLDKVSVVEMLRATAAGAALAWIMSDDRCLAQADLTRLVRRWCGGERATAGRIATRHRLVAAGAWSRRFMLYIERRNAAMESLLVTHPATRRGAERRPPRPAAEPTVGGRWQGPLNLRGLLADLPDATRSAVAALIDDDRQNHSLLLNLALRADGSRTRAELIEETSFALRRPIDQEIAQRLFGALLESRWVTEAPPGSADRTGGATSA
jgi:hypothetical protein